MGLTPKQRKFAERIVSGMNPSEAYRAAYDCARMKPATVATQAQRLMRHPNIAPMIEQGFEAAAKSAVWSRETALRRLEAVNLETYERLTETGREGGLDRAASDAFFKSLDRLEAMAGGEAPRGPVVLDDIPEES